MKWKQMKSTFVLLLATLSLFSCATYVPVPSGYSGPTAQMLDTGFQETGGKGQLFYVEAVDGNTIENARITTARASHGRGFNLSISMTGRHVKAQPTRFRVVGTHVTAAPIHEIASRTAGTFFRVEGDIDFTPIAGKTYAVAGTLTKKEASVWIEDWETKQPVTKKIVAN
jgi:hypothetical protein